MTNKGRNMINERAQSRQGGFISQRGTGQGDVLSPTCWAAVVDVLLTALEIDVESIGGGAWVRSSANEGYKRRNTAYADDLLSTTPGADQLQRKADIVSAFCSIMDFRYPRES